LRNVPEAARAIGLQIRVLNASTSADIEAAFATIAIDRPDAALFVASTASSTPDECNLRHSRRTIGFRQPIPRARLSKSAG
jgi:hypothetical protein